jgi:tetratricopeptide (TPR) repeat protein
MPQSNQTKQRARSSLSLPRAWTWAGAALIAMSVIILYWPAVQGGFILDDDILLTSNPLVKAPNGLSRIWFSHDPIDYWPITNSSFWIQWRLFEMNPTGYHVVNLILFIADCLLIWLLLKRLAIPGAFLAALLYAVHPINVESVAWVSQHKNVLSLFFFLLSLLWFIKSEMPDPVLLGKSSRASTENQVSTGSVSNRWYFLSLLAFTLAMLSKGSVAILPLVLLLLAWWQRGRISKLDLWRSTPFFTVAIVLTLVNIWFQTHGAESAIRSASFLERLAGAGGVIWFYLFKALVPIELVFVYPQWNIDVANPLWWFPLVTAVAATVLLFVICYRRPSLWARAILFAWLFFCIALLPVLGFVDVGFMKFSLVADHYQYIALIAVVAFVAAVGASWERSVKRSAQPIFAIAAAIAVISLSTLTRQQTSLYADAITLDKATLQRNPQCWLIHANLAIDLAALDRNEEALAHAQEAVSLKPDYPVAHCALGNALAKLGKPQEAIDQYKQALTLDPDFHEALCDLGTVLEMKGNSSEAIEYLQRALQLDPGLVQAHWFLARALADVNRLPESLEHLQVAAELHPRFLEAEMSMGHVLDVMGRYQEAIGHYEKALQLEPNLPQAYAGMADVYAEMNRSTDAIAAARQGLNLARSSGQLDLAAQLESWLNDYQSQHNTPSGAH